MPSSVAANVCTQFLPTCAQAAELCFIPACPVDCIELVAYPRTLNEDQRLSEQDNLRGRYYAHLSRIENQVNDNTNARPVVSMVQAKLNDVSIDISENQAKHTIEAAKLRTQIKKLQKQLAVINPTKQQQLDALEQTQSLEHDASS